jgi:hypothetical protein
VQRASSKSPFDEPELEAIAAVCRHAELALRLSSRLINADVSAGLDAGAGSRPRSASCRRSQSERAVRSGYRPRSSRRHPGRGANRIPHCGWAHGARDRSEIRRDNQALADRTPMAVWREAIAGARAVDRMDNAAALPIMSTAAEADAASCCVIERNTERSGFQSRNRRKRSCGAGPSHDPDRAVAQRRLLRQRRANSARSACRFPRRPSYSTKK